MDGIDEQFLELFGQLPRAGPGDKRSTLRALEVVRRTLEPRRVLDAGCGPGVQTLVLARALPEAEILAVDLLPSMAERAQTAFAAARLSPRVRADVRDMCKPGLVSGSIDLVWSEGAAYAVGVQAALEAWRPFLSGTGHVAFTDLTWTGAERPAEVRDWLCGEYPDVTDVPGTLARIEAAGLSCVETFGLPDSAWWEAYYAPLELRIGELRARYASAAQALALLDAAALEVEMFRRFSRAYGYTFFVARLR